MFVKMSFEIVLLTISLFENHRLDVGKWIRQVKQHTVCLEIISVGLLRLSKEGAHLCREDLGHLQ